MRPVLSALVFTFLGFTAFLIIVNFPQVKTFSSCHQQITSIYHQPNLVTRHAYMSDEQICVQNKSLILDGLSCFVVTDPQGKHFYKEHDFMLTLAQYLSKSSKTIMDVVLDHNETCPTKKTRILYDLDSASPFAANF